MSGRGKGLGKALTLVLAAGAAAAISKYRLHEEPLLAYKRLKQKVFTPPPPKMDTGPLDWEAIRATANATMRFDTQDGSRYLETWVRGQERPKRFLLPDDGARGIARFRGNSIPQDIIDVFQTPGRQHVHMDIGSNDTLWMIKDDSNLPADQMFITFDVLAPNVSWAKKLEGWTLSPLGYVGSLSVSLTAEMISVPFGTGVSCVGPSDATDYTNNCSNGQAALITRTQMGAMLFRKPVGNFPFPPIWEDVVWYNSSVWTALGGKIVRIIWERD